MAEMISDDIRCDMWSWLHLPVRRLMEEGKYDPRDRAKQIEAVQTKCVELWPHEKAFYADLFAAMARHDRWGEALGCCERALGQRRVTTRRIENEG